MTVLHPYRATLPTALRRALQVTGPVRRFAVAALVGAIGVGAISGFVLQGNAAQILAALIFYFAGAALALQSLRQSHPHETMGLANVVTLLRFGLTASLVAPLMAGGGAAWASFVLASLALCLDGLDGWIARRQRLTSRFGAGFDMEVDAALGLILALSAWSAGTVGALVLVLGLPRYVFVGLGIVLPWLAQPLPDRFGRKLVCVVQIAALIAMQLPILPAALAQWMVLGAALALCWSFGRDIFWLWRHRT